MPPVACFSGSENVSWMRESGEISCPGAGLTSTIGSVETGNQLTRTGSPRRSQLRAALEISAVPEAVCGPSETTPPLAAT